MDYKQELVKRLKEDCEVLMKNKIPKALENISDDKGVNTYRNLTKALAENIKVIDEYDWKLMYSEYSTGKKAKKQVAVWEQNNDGEIRNHKVWDVKVAENISKFSNCFKDNIELTPIQKELIAMKSGKSCLRGEGSTFGVLMSAINYAYNIPFVNIGVISYLNIGVEAVRNKLLELLDNYLVSGVITNVDMRYSVLTITLSNENKITVISDALENARCYRFDVVYLCDDIRMYDKENLQRKLKDYDRDSQVIYFNVVNDSVEYYDIKTRNIVKFE